MKKLLIILLSVFMAVSFAYSESIDLSGLSYEELVALKDRIDLAIWNSQEWQEVEVPQGLYVVGQDIPAGTWTIRCAIDHYSVVRFGDTLDPNGKEIKITNYYHRDEVVSPNYKLYEAGKDITETTITVKNGDYIHIDKASVIFTPYSGKPDLGFR